MDEAQPPLRSLIPQFLLDTQHPWIIKHRATLELLPDVESFLHSSPGAKRKPSPSPSKPHLQRDDASTQTAPSADDGLGDLEVPADLFHSLNINNNRSDITRAGWPNARDRLREMRRCPSAALARVRSLHIEVWVHRGPFHARNEQLRAEEWQDLDGPRGDELLNLFASVLAAMTGLERLRWAILPDFAPRFREELVNRNARGLRLPSVVRLEPAPFCEYMVDACPNIEALEGAKGIVWKGEKGEERYAEMLVKAASKAPKLKVFSGMAALTPSFILEMVKAMPRLTSLRMDGRIPRCPMMRDPVTGERRLARGSVTLKDILAVLAEFPDLEELGLPAAPNLGYTSGFESRCGNPFLGGPEAAALGYRMNREEHEIIERVASAVVEMLPRLKRFTIDGREATITGGISIELPTEDPFTTDMSTARPSWSFDFNSAEI
ncbi:hypothetical protein GQ53DRAFT_825336 [Thozetella sp. PMI_491]|nr:hypothetical protein GQ53DRAFT_825336 [Thozetella sp. PMI_491]